MDACSKQYSNQTMLLRDLSLDGGDYLAFDLGDLRPADRGRILDFALRLKDVPPERRVAVAVFLTERDGEDQEYPRGLRTWVVPAHHAGAPQDVDVSPIRFILPAELDMSGDGTRALTVRVDAHYIDRGGACRLPGQP